MNLLLIAWRNMQQRGLSSWLTMLSMALGVSLVVIVLAISGVVTESFQRNSSVGYNLIVGAKGSPLQLTLNTVFYLSRPVENVPYSYFLEFQPGNGRQEAFQKIGGRINEPDRAGKYSQYMMGGFAIPVCLGDYFGPFRVVGTTPQFFELLRYGEAGDMEYRFAQGRNFQEHSAENGYFEAVIGSRAAREMNVKLGDQVSPSHGDPEGKGHGEKFKIVGILAPTGTPNDRALFINIEGFYWMDKHAKPLEDALAAEKESQLTYAESPGTATSTGLPEKLPIHQREVTAILVKPGGESGIFAAGMERAINKSLQAQAASPVREITNMLMMFVQPVQFALLVLTMLVCIVSAIAILVSIYNSMSERRRDIAVMRALGARRDIVLAIILAESVLIALGGAFIGWVLGHAIGAIASPWVEEQTGIQVGFFTINSWEWTLIPGIIVLAILAGLIPAFSAYRTDVSRNLNA
jgi:putative ABC transport system permease protein